MRRRQVAGHGPEACVGVQRVERRRQEQERQGTRVLSGGSFQNLRLLASLRGRLEQSGFRVLSHRLVPPNDGGVSYGQAAVAAATLGAP